MSPRLNKRSLPNTAGDYDLGTLASEQIAAQRNGTPSHPSVKHQHRHRVTQIEVENLIGRKTMHGRDRVLGKKIIYGCGKERSPVPFGHRYVSAKYPPSCG